MKKAQKLNSSNNFNYISLFSGAGGLDIGLERAGFRNRLCIENNATCRSTLELNRPDWMISNPGQIEDLSSENILKQSGCSKCRLQMIVGGPPCQPFSKAGYWHKGDSDRLSDKRANTLVQFTRVVNDLLPKVVLFENVKGFIYKNKDEAYNFLLEQYEKININNNVNYCVVPFVINCADYGVPQLRERFFIVAHREGLKFNVPRGYYGENNEPHYNAWDAIGDLDIDLWPKELEVSGKWSELLPTIPEGKNYLWHTKRGEGEDIFGWRTRYWNFLLKLSKSKPSWTIPAQPGPSAGPFHWKNRKLSIREICRLQTIPDDWQVCGNYRDAYTQVGNAVPSLIGEIIGREIATQFFDIKMTNPLTLLPKRSHQDTGVEKLQPVDKRFLIDQNTQEHPGEGKGPGALRRVQGEQINE